LSLLAFVFVFFVANLLLKNLHISKKSSTFAAENKQKQKKCKENKK